MLRRWGIALLAILLIIPAILSGCGEPETKAEPTGQQETIAGDSQRSLRDTVLYYRDGSGYVVPVMRRIPWEEGIGRAALRFLIAGSGEDAQLAAMGIYPPLPAGTEVDLDIDEGLATVDLRTKTDCASTTEEAAMVAAVVNTLLEFDTVDEVKLLSNGKEVEKLPLGTDLTCYTEPVPNIEPAGAPAGEEGKIRLYFANQTGTFLVPVLRVMDVGASPVEAAEEMLSPAEGTGLVSLLPPTTEIHSVTIGENGVATIDLSGEFQSLSELPGMERMAVRGLIMTLTQFKNIEDVQITINGEPYEPAATTMASLHDEFLNTFD